MVVVVVLLVRNVRPTVRTGTKKTFAYNWDGHLERGQTERNSPDVPGHVRRRRGEGLEQAPRPLRPYDAFGTHTHQDTGRVRKPERAASWMEVRKPQKLEIVSKKR